MSTSRTLALCFVGAVALGTRAEEPLALAAQQAYANGAYAEALHLYDSLAQDRTSAALLYNIGNCHAKLNEVPQAILQYERALRLAPGAEDVQANLDLMRSRTVDRVSALPAFTLGTAWDRVRGGKDVDQWARRSLWACVFACVLAAAAVLVRSTVARRALGGLAIAGGLVTVLCMVLAAYRVHEADDRSEAIIMTSKLDVLGEPREGATKLFLLHAGTKLRVLQSEGDWYEVKLANGSVGWAQAKALTII